MIFGSENMNFKELEELINSGPKVIRLTEDVILDDGEEDIFKQGIKIDVIKVIEGNNHTIDAKCKTRIFNVIAGKDIIIKNVTLKNAYSNDGGAILNESRLYLENCKLLDNYSENNGGAILNNAFLSVDCCNFSNNNSYSSGSAVFNSENSKFKCTSSEFSSNISKLCAGVIYAEKDVDVSVHYSDFYDEDKNIIISHSGEVDWSLVDVYQKESEIEGAFIDTSVFCGLDFQTLDDLLKNSTNEVILYHDFKLRDNEMDIFKEGIDISQDNLIIDGNGHRIDANMGSRIFKVNADNVTFKNIEFCFAKSENGGAVYNFSDLIRFENCKFHYCSANEDGGAIYSLNGKMEINNCKFDECSADGSGGVIYSEGKKLIVKDSKFSFNRSPCGGVFCTGTCNVENCIFKENYSRSEGAVISNGLVSKLPSGFHFKNCEFCGNSVNYELCYSSFASCDIILKNCKFSDELFEFSYGVNTTVDNYVVFPSKK